MTSDSLRGLACPRCENTQVRALALVHASGISTGRMSGVGLGGDGGAFGAAVSSSQSALSMSAAPPVAKRPRDAVIAAIALAGIAFMFLSMLAEDPLADPALRMSTIVAPLAIVAAGVFWASRRHSYMKATYAPALAQWQRSFLCDRCGSVFEVPSSAHLQRVL